jgi:hypothetical protein
MREMMPPRLTGDPGCRTFDEARIVEHLVHGAYAREASLGEHAYAKRECRAALDRWVALGLPFVRAGDGTRLFDPAEVVNTMKWAGARHGDSFYEGCFVATARALVREFHPSGGALATTAPPPATLAPRGMRVTLSREFDTSRLGPGARALLRDLRVDCFVEPDVDVDLRIAPGRLDARLPVPATRSVTVTARISATLLPRVAGSSAEPLTQAERELYTQPNEGLVRVTPRVRALSAQLVGATRDDQARVRSFWNFLVDELACGTVAHESVDGAHPQEHVLDTGWFDCQLGSALLVALCRAQEIPARVVGGYLVYPSSATLHWWAEVWLPDGGWIPLDTICRDLSVGGRDTDWRDYFLGNVDYRLKTESLPRNFSRTPGLRVPNAWRLLMRVDGAATEIGLYACDTALPVYRDRLEVTFAPPGAAEGVE